MHRFDKSKSMGILFDSTRCIGCLSCEESCDEANRSSKRKWSKEHDKDYRKPPDGLSADKWVHMTAHALPLNNGEIRKTFNWDDAYELKEAGQYAFARHSCMHCLEPACASVCPVGALVRHENGPVTYTKDKCMGCRYCMVACPFSIPKWEWHEQLPYVRKCTMCYVRQKKGEGPNCAENCSGNDDGPALLFGNRDDLLYEAERRLHAKKDKYYHHVFGANELGGTSVLFIIDKNLPPEAIGFPTDLSVRSIPDRASGPMSTVPYWALGLSSMFGGLLWVIKRRNKLMFEQQRQAKRDVK